MTSSPSPISLKILFQLSKRWNSYTNLDNTSLLLCNSTKNMIFEFFDYLEKRHGYVLVSTALSYLTLSRSGIYIYMCI